MAAISPELSPTVLNTNAGILAKTNVLGQGSWGLVLGKAVDNIQKFPNHVMKIMIPTDRNKPSNELKKERKRIINEFMSNNNEKDPIKYKRTFTSSMFKALQNKINNSELKNAIEHNKNIALNVYHMPNLGVSLYATLNRIHGNPNHLIKNKQNINIIVKQLCKLLKQIHRLVKLEWIHGDIRAQNIMVNPTSFVFTLIDFDWLYPMNDFPIQYREAFGYYINPPEVFLAYRNNMLTQCLKTTIIPRLKKQYASTFNVIPTVDKWLQIINLGNLSDAQIDEFCKEFDNLLQRKKFIKSLLVECLQNKQEEYGSHNDVYIQIKRTKKQIKRTEELDDITNSYIQMYIDEKPIDNILAIQQKFIETYDSYCISSFFLVLLYTMYPDMIEQKEDPQNVFTPIFEMIHKVLLPLADLNWRERKKINDVIVIINKIEENAQNASSHPPAPSAPAPSASVPGGSRTYKKRKIRKHQRTYKK
jgi:serine/threonine protein kinase